MRREILMLLFGISLSTATTLDELVKSGLEKSSVIKGTNLQGDLIKAKIEESRSKRFGNVDLVGGYTHYNLPRTLAPIVPSSLSPNSSVETTNDLFSTGIQYAIPIFEGGALQRQVEIDQISKVMSQKRQRLTREELIYNIRSLYLSGLSLQELISAQNLYIEALERLKDIISKSVSLGKKAKIDIIKADSSLQEEIGKSAQMRSSLKVIKLTLKAITHISNIDHLEPIDVSVGRESVNLDRENFDDLDRFELMDLDIKRGGVVISKTKAIQEPQIMLNSYVGYSYDIDNSLSKEYLWHIGFNLKWNIFDFGQNDAKLQQAKISQLQSIIEKEATTEGFKRLLSEAIGKIDKSLIDYQTNLSKLELFEESQKIEEERYSAGIATLNDLLLAKSKTQLAKSRLIESEYGYQNGLFYLDYLLERGED